jgi:hypothetical protein
MVMAQKVVDGANIDAEINFTITDSHLRKKSDLRFKLIWVVQPAPPKVNSFPFTPNQWLFPPCPASTRGPYRGRHECDAGCGGPEGAGAQGDCMVSQNLMSGKRGACPKPISFRFFAYQSTH